MSAPPVKQHPTSMRWIGQNMKRVEDPRLLTGRGKYIDDMAVPNMAHAAVLRSPYAHARIVAIDVSRARALPGVLLVLTGAEAAEQTGPLPCFSNPPTAQYCIATDRVRHVGEAVVAVVAESRYIAEDAIDLIDVEYEPLPVVVNPEDALTSSGDAVLHPERGPNNIALQRKLTFGSYDEDMQRADVIVRRKARWPRSGAQPMETVGAIASYDEGTGKFTVYANTSMYNYVGWLMAVSLNVSASKLNLIPTIAGGSFGSKLFAHKVPVLAATLARACGRPVKYLEDRLDNMMSCDNHGSDRIYDLELGLKRDGTMLAFGMRVIDDYGAYLQFGVGHHGNAAAQLTGPYRINSAQIDLTAVFTNK
ncbi:MAG: molybdopterin cofactor-binding domain-containing protein, partial [Kouleothrix sp.]